MSQLALNIVERLAYGPANFLLHAGVADRFREALNLFEADAFKICFFHGAARSGKTHLSIKLADTLASRAFFPRLVEGAELPQWFEGRLQNGGFDTDEVLIIDDAHTYLQKVQPGNSGAFVNLVEHLRSMRAGLVLFSSKTLDELPCDEHVKSRLLPGCGFQIGEPEDFDMPGLVAAMGRQRGIDLSDRQVAYLARRLRRQVSAVEDVLGNVNHLSQVLGKAINLPLITDAI